MTREQEIACLTWVLNHQTAEGARTAFFTAYSLIAEEVGCPFPEVCKWDRDHDIVLVGDLSLSANRDRLERAQERLAELTQPDKLTREQEIICCHWLLNHQGEWPTHQETYAALAANAECSVEAVKDWDDLDLGDGPFDVIPVVNEKFTPVRKHRLKMRLSVLAEEGARKVEAAEATDVEPEPHEEPTEAKELRRATNMLSHAFRASCVLGLPPVDIALAYVRIKRATHREGSHELKEALGQQERDIKAIGQSLPRAELHQLANTVLLREMPVGCAMYPKSDQRVLAVARREIERLGGDLGTAGGEEKEEVIPAKPLSGFEANHETTVGPVWRIHALRRKS